MAKLQAPLQALLADTKSSISALEKLVAKSKNAYVGVSLPEVRDGRVRVVIEAQTSRDMAQLGAELAAERGQIEIVHENYLQAWVPLVKLAALSRRSDVRYVRLPMTPILDQGSVVSEGAAIIGSSEWNGAGLDGRGVKVGILDTGFQGLERLIGRELPERDRIFTRSFRRDGQLFDARAPSPHGTAVTEIVYDVAPGATLYPTAFSTDIELRQAIDYLATELRVDVISTSFNFPSACMTGPGIFESALAGARRNGALWTASTGNNAASYYTGKWSDDDGNRLHNFKESDEQNTIEVLLEEYVYPGGTRVATFILIGFFSWEAICTGAGNDYELTLFDENGREVQQLDRNGLGQLSDWYWRPGVPVKIFLATLDYPQSQIGQTIKLSFGIRQLRSSAPQGSVDANIRCCSVLQFEYVTKEGSVGFYEPAVSSSVMSVGAFHHANEKCPQYFCPDSSLLVYSSRGPTKDGRIKPDITAPTHVSTASYGRYTGDGPRDNLGFTGTSAAQPHIAGAAALVKQAFPELTPSQIQDYLEKRAEDRGPPGKDNDWGAGQLILGKAPAKPKPATELQSKLRSPQEVELLWIDNSDNEDGFQIERRLESDFSNNYTEIAKTGSNVTTYLDAGLQAETGYCYRVRSFNSNGASDYTQDSCILTQAANRLPVVNAGLDQSVIVGTTVQLDGSQSSDPDGEPLKYDWKFFSMPEGSQAQLSDPTLVNPTFIADKVGEYLVELKVSDGRGGEASTRVKITAQAPPVPTLALDMTRLEFQATQGGSNPESQSVQISNSGGGTLVWTATTDQPWLKITPDSARAEPSSTLAVIVDITGLDAGVYEGRITITAIEATNSPQIITVALHIANP
jgi:subtilisin family serine protease